MYQLGHIVVSPLSGAMQEKEQGIFFGRPVIDGEQHPVRQGIGTIYQNMFFIILDVLCSNIIHLQQANEEYQQ